MRIKLYWISNLRNSFRWTSYCNLW
jgi:hypothetical protein